MLIERKDEFQAVIRKRLSEQRYQHSLNVAKTARCLAEKYGANPDRAELAGLLHDSCKDLPKSEQLSYLVLNDVPLTPCEVAAPKLYHAMCGALFAEKELHITDRNVLDAIRYHTTGRWGMTLLEKVVFIADFISEEREYTGVEEMRKKAAVDLDAAIVEGLGFTIRDLIARQKPVHTDTVDAYNEAVINQWKKQKENATT